ncbi:MAG: PVC-type heme-binding CxxCH protein [Pirellulales bacterium]
MHSGLIRTAAASLALVGLLLPAPWCSLLAADGDVNPEHLEGSPPVGADGTRLNLDLETGTLEGWRAEGDAFAKQPIEGDTVFARRQDMRSGHAGRFWIGSYERGGDQPQGTLTSVPFKVTHRYASFLVAGGRHPETCVEIVDRETLDVILRASGDETEQLKPVAVDLRRHVGGEIFIRLVDRHSGHWGHLNFDDFRFHEQRPDVPNRTDVYAHAGLDAVEAAAAMTVPEGFAVTLFAGEPDVQQPIAQAIDGRGRLWVAEAYSYPFHVPDEEARDRILIFEDVDGDGRFDRRTVFIDKLNLVSGIEIGFGGVWVGMAPYLLFIPDRDGDDVPDGPPEKLLDGWGFEDTHETLNAFTWGPDGWLYGCHGVFTHSRVGKPGTPDDQRVPINAGIWRYHPTWHEFEVFAHGTSNPWGIDFNDQGQALVTACVIPHLFHVIQGGRYQRQAGQHFNPYTYADIQTIALHRHWVGANPHAGNNRSDEAGGGHAHAGAMIYLGGSWPEPYRNQIFMNNIHGARLNMDLLAPRGSGYVGDRAPDFLLANDAWSQIINLQYGPDGQMYMIDWYDKNQCHHRDPDGHDRTNGRIFKVSFQGARGVTVDMAEKTDEELVELQLEPNDWYVRHARRLLQERGGSPGVHEALTRLAFEHADETRRLRGLWALHVTGGLTAERTDRGLSNDSPLVRAWTVQLAMESGNPKASLLKRFAELAAADPSPVVRLYLASALQRLPLDRRAAILTALLGHSEDATDHNLPLMYWYAAEPLASENNLDAALRLAQASRIPLVDRFLTRRLAQLGTERAIEMLVHRVGRTANSSLRQAILEEMNEGFKGRRGLAMPGNWRKVYQACTESDEPALRSQAMALGLVFGDPNALRATRSLLTDEAADAAAREQALAALVRARDPELPPVLQSLVAGVELRRAALRGLAAYDDQQTPKVVLDAYAGFDSAAKRDALGTLASRPKYAGPLLDAVAAGRVPAGDLSADLIRQLRNLNNDELNARIAEVWGTVNDTPEERLKLIGYHRAIINSKRGQPPDLALGRAVYAKTCQQCHVLFGGGGNVGPELTGSNRADLDYMLSNVIDPSALIGKDYQAVVIQTTDGRTLTGIIKAEDRDSLTLATANETVVIPQQEIDIREVSSKSMMPDDQLNPMSDHEIRSLVAYLASPIQTPMLATVDNAPGWFNGRDLSGWHGAAELWSVEDGQIVGRTSGLDHNEFLKSELLAGDFRLSLEVKLVDNEGNSGIQFRSEALDGGEVKGYQADVGAGWWGKLYEEHGRGLLWDKPGEMHVKPGQWNRYEIVCEGTRLRTWINGQPCVDLDDPEGTRRGIFALQLHSGGPTEVRFRNLVLDVGGPAGTAAGK